MKYAGALIVVLSCSAPNHGGGRDADAVIDADPCSVPVPDEVASGCVTDGLTGVVFDGTTPWTLTGTTTFGAAGSGSGSSMPLTQTMYVLRRGSGHCAFAISSVGPITQVDSSTDEAITDTRAYGASSGETPHPWTYSFELCEHPDDQVLHYHDMRVSQWTTGPEAFETTTDGKLTR